MTAQLEGEHYDLRYHSAQDHGQYDFLKDLWRLERYVTEVQNSVGLVVLLSNDSSYWTAPRQDHPSVQFSVHEGRQVQSLQEMHWGAGAGANTRKRREL